MKLPSKVEAKMNHTKRNTIVLFVVSLILFVVQAGIWWKTASRGRTETDKQNIEIRHQPSEMPLVVGTCLLIAASVLASIPHKPHT